MLNAASILRCGFGRNADGYEPFGKKGMALIHSFRDFAAAIEQGDISRAIHFDQTVFAKMLHGDADTGLCIIKFVYDIDGTNATVSFMQNQNGFQIIFCRFEYFNSVINYFILEF